MSDTSRSRGNISFVKKLTFLGAVTFLSLLAALILGEILLRLVPIPGITYHSYYYDELTGGHYYPNTTLIYRNERGDHVRRRVNGWGFADVQHEIEKEPGVIRIGFFGDSYTQAIQVPIEQTFFRRIEEELNERNPTQRYECLAFGVSGYSMVRSYLQSSRWTDSLDLDWTVYVFAENDVGDQMRLIRGNPTIPYAYLSGDTFAIDFSFRERLRYKTSKLHRSLQFLKANSLVVSTIVGRLKLLMRHGIKLRVTEEERHMDEEGDKTKMPKPVHKPSAWPDTLVAMGAELGNRVFDKWVGDVRAAGGNFAVIYVPRPFQMHMPYAEQDTWAAWLVECCRRNGVDFIDPSPKLLEVVRTGGEAFYDHFTSEGHDAVAKAFVEQFADEH